MSYQPKDNLETNVEIFTGFLVFNGEALLYSLLELAIHNRTKEQLLRNIPEKGFIGNVPF